MADNKLLKKFDPVKRFSAYITVFGIALVASLLYQASPGWTLVLFAIIVIGGFFLITETMNPIGLARKRRTAARHEGWNQLGTITIPNSDPYLSIRAEENSDGIAIPLRAGVWVVHVQAAMAHDGYPRLQDQAMRIVSDPHWATNEWRWPSTDEPVVRAAIGPITEVGRLPIELGDALVYPGRKKKRKHNLKLDPGMPGSYQVGVGRDDQGQVVAVIARLQATNAPIMQWTPDPFD